jgi:hypothetical protein
MAGARESTRITAADFVGDSTDFAAVVDFMATGDFRRGIIPWSNVGDNAYCDWREIPPPSARILAVGLQL